MINYKDSLNKKEEKELISILEDLKDFYTDFYITKDNMRLFLKDNPELINDCLKNGDKIAYCEDGILLIYGLKSDYRNYVKILSKNAKTVKKLIQVIDWHLSEDLFVKVKKKNPIVNTLKGLGFEFSGSRGREILLKRGANSVK